jgi:hypothetical protein
MVNISVLTITKRDQYFTVAGIAVECECFHCELHCSGVIVDCECFHYKLHCVGGDMVRPQAPDAWAAKPGRWAGHARLAAPQATDT